MCRCFTLFSRAAVSDLSMKNDQRRSFCISLSCFDRCADSSEVISIFYLEYAKSLGLKTLCSIFCKCDICISFDGNIVRVVENDQFSKS